VIYYRPTDGDPLTTPVRTRPRTCFLMTQLGGPVPPILAEIRSALLAALNEHGYRLVDADSLVTGKDFLLKIFEMIVAVPLGIAIIHEQMRPGTLANVFYELGMMQAYGKETLVIRTDGENNPLLAIDYLRRAYLLTGKRSLKRQATRIFDDAQLSNRAKNSVETLLIGFD
jgi:hypothetical protein